MLTYMVCPSCKEIVQINQHNFELLFCKECGKMLVKCIKNHAIYLVTLAEYRELQEY